VPVTRFAVLPSSTYLFTAGVEVVFIFTWSYSYTHHSWQDSSGRGIGPSQRPLPDNTNNHKRQKSIPPVGFEPTIPANARPQTYALDRAATGIGVCNTWVVITHVDIETFPLLRRYVAEIDRYLPTFQDDLSI
jgi:hypothetical protein